VSTDPGFVRPGPKGAPFAPGGQGRTTAPPATGPEVRLVEVLPLRAGDRLIVHIEGAAGMSAGGAHQAGMMVRDLLKLDDLEFDVPVLVVSPGIRVEVARPA